MSTEVKIQGGHLLAKALVAKGVTRIYSLCGGFTNPFYDGCLEYGIEVIETRNEQEAGFLGCMQSRLTREPVVCVAEPSGFTNFISAFAEAHKSGDPVIFIGIASNIHNMDRRGFKEMPQERLVESLTKYSALVNEGPRIPEFFNKAYNIAANLPMGPVSISIPINFLYSGYTFSDNENKRSYNLSPIKVHQPGPQADDVSLIVDTLSRAKKPVIISGIEVWQSSAENELEEFVRNTNIPYFYPNHTEIRAQDFDPKYNMGLADVHQNPASNLIHQESDVVLFLGCRLDYSLGFGNPPLFNPKSTLIAVNSTAVELAENHITDIQVLASPKMLLTELSKHSQSLKKGMDWAEQIYESRDNNNKKWVEASVSNQEPIHPLRACMDALSFLGEDDYLVVDGGDAHGWQEVATNINILEGNNVKAIAMSGPFAQLGIGSSFATSIKMHAPQSKVLLIAGDGSFGLSPGLPLETAISRKLPIVVVILNNQSYGMIKNQQLAIWKRCYSTDLRNVPFHSMIEGAGGHGELVEKPEELIPAVRRAFESGKPAVVNVIVDNVMSPITEGLVDRRTKSSIE